MEGYLDPADADIRDHKWWIKVRWTLDWLEAKHRTEVRKLQHDLNCAMLDYFTGDRALDLHWDQALSIQNAIKKYNLPWAAEEEEVIRHRAFNDLFDLWKRMFGDPVDPAVRKKINYTAEALMTQAALEANNG